VSAVLVASVSMWHQVIRYMLVMSKLIMGCQHASRECLQQKGSDRGERNFSSASSQVSNDTNISIIIALHG
jgi:hypothetical protein